MNTNKDILNKVQKEHSLVLQKKQTRSLMGQNDFKSLADRSQKITTAVFLISDLLPDTNSLKSLIRNSASSAMKDLFANLIHKKETALESAYNFYYELLSYLDLAFQTGSVSHMNYEILEREISRTQDMIKAASLAPQEKEEILDIDLGKIFSEDENLNEAQASINFSEEKKEVSLEEKEEVVPSPISLKSHSSHSVISVKNNPVSEIAQVTKKVQRKELSKKTNSKKEEKAKRHQNIIDILAQKKDASITEICSLFKDCSSKTIQRDLNELIEKNIVLKKGDRRWSTYNLKKVS